jgi:hypothetical protein
MASPPPSRSQPDSGHDHHAYHRYLGHVRVDVKEDACGASADVGDEDDDQAGDDPADAQLDGLPPVVVVSSTSQA